jgi:sulfide dehydrogenase cytochrome subunit
VGKLRNLMQTVSIAVLVLAASQASADVSGMLMMCTSCHGEDGRGEESDIPIIAGIPAIVQEDALFAYQDGARNCSSKPMMCKSISRLTEEQIVELVAHFAAMPYVPAGEEFDAALAQTGKTLHQENCAICHGADDPGDAEASILHGQRTAYLRHALQEYAAGTREQLPAMQKKISALSSDDFEALLNYYASFRP